MSVIDDAPSPAPAAAGRTDDVLLAEKAVIASMVSYRNAAEEALELLGGEDSLTDGTHRAVYEAVRWVTEEGGLDEGGSLRVEEMPDAGVQRRFAAVLGRLVTAERGVWRTGQAAVILGDLVAHATPGWRSDAAVVVRAAGQRRTLAALHSAWQTAAAPGFDPAEHGEMIRGIVDGALAGAAETTGAVNAADLYQGALERMETAEPPGVIQFPWLAMRDLVPYLRPGQLVGILARPSLGKALALDTPLPTPDGWTTMGDVQVGDRLFGADGKPTTVVAATNVMHDRPCYEVRFSDGTVIVADAEHQWKTTTRASRRQAAEHKTRYHWSAEQIRRVKKAAAAAAAEPDRLVTISELLPEIGREFLAIFHTRVIARVPSVIQERSYRRRVDRKGTIKSYLHPTPTYSRQLLLKLLAEHVAIPIAASQSSKHEQVVTTAQIAASVIRTEGGGARANHAVAVCGALQQPDADLPVPPYVLGAWLGDGDSNGAGFTTNDPEIVTHLEAEGVTIRPHRARMRYSILLPREVVIEDRVCIGCGSTFTPKEAHVLTCGRKCGGSRAARNARTAAATPTCLDCGSPTSRSTQCEVCRFAHGTMTARLRALGVLNDKHIPVGYLRASEEQRRALLAGLLDTDGTVSATGNAQYCSTSAALIAGVRELVVSLGYRCGVSSKQVRGRTTESSTAYVLTFTPKDNVFRLARKAIALEERRRPGGGSRSHTRTIVSVERVASVPVRCVQVDAPDHLYLASRSMIPTHNSLVAGDLARYVGLKMRLPVVLFTMEMDRTEVIDRLIAAESGVQHDYITSGEPLTDAAWERIGKAQERFSGSELIIDDTPRISLAHIRACLRGMAARRKPAQAIIIDYLQLMDMSQGGVRAENRQQEVSATVGGLKAIARQFRIPVVVLCQLNRGPEQRTDKRPFLSDARESGSIDTDLDIAILIHRPDFYEPESPRAGEADLIVDKHRGGRRGTATVGFQGHYARLVDLARIPTPAAQSAGENDEHRFR